LDFAAALEEGWGVEVMVEGGREAVDVEGAASSLLEEEAARAALLRGGFEGVPVGAVDGTVRAKGLGLELGGGGGGAELEGGSGRSSSGGGMG